MELLGIFLSFTLIVILISKKVDMGLSLFIGAFTAALFLPLEWRELLETVMLEIISPTSLQLMVIVGLISGLGYIMKETGDLDDMIDSLIGIFKNAKFLIMLVPALIGTLNVPGGAILSAPMVEESGDQIDLTNLEKNSINLFFRHIGFFIYPLYTSMILASELLNISSLLIIRYNLIIMFSGLITAYFLLFRDINAGSELEQNNRKLSKNFIGFLSGFASILVTLFLALIINMPFHLAVTAGVATAILKRPPEGSKLKGYIDRVKNFFTTGVDYALIFVIAGVMAFKAVVESSGVVDILAESMIQYGIPLPLMIIILGLITGYITGVHIAATGLLISLLEVQLLDFPLEIMGAYVSLLFTVIILGYLMSPLHLCMALNNKYFNVTLGAVYKKLGIPVLVMIFVALIQVLILN